AESREALSDLRQLQRNAFQRLKAPLTQQEDDEVCYTAGLAHTSSISSSNSNTAPLLSVAAKDVLSNNSEAVVGSFDLGWTSTSNGSNSGSNNSITNNIINNSNIGKGWRVFEDRLGEGR